jgi:phosphoenolpyruvate synthase/pyruvate phosphate dikinase
MFNVPSGFILTTASYYHFMAEVGLLGELGKLSDRLELAGLNLTEIERISRDYTAIN